MSSFFRNLLRVLLVFAIATMGIWVLYSKQKAAEAQQRAAEAQERVAEAQKEMEDLKQFALQLEQERERTKRLEQELTEARDELESQADEKLAWEFLEGPETRARMLEETLRETVRILTRGEVAVPDPFVGISRDGLDLQIDIGYNEGMIKAEIGHYSPGGFTLADSPFAAATVASLIASFHTLFQQYIHDECLVVTEIIGVADGLRVRPGAAYNGSLGAIASQVYYSQDTGIYKSLSLFQGDPLDNERIAFLRAFGVLLRLQGVQAIADGELQLVADTVADVGPEHRKVIVRIKMVGALKKHFDELPPKVKMKILHMDGMVPSVPQVN